MATEQAKHMAELFASVSERTSKPGWIWQRFATSARGCICAAPNPRGLLTLKWMPKACTHCGASRRAPIPTTF